MLFLRRYKHVSCVMCVMRAYGCPALWTYPTTCTYYARSAQARCTVQAREATQSSSENLRDGDMQIQHLLTRSSRWTTPGETVFSLLHAPSEAPASEGFLS